MMSRKVISKIIIVLGIGFIVYSGKLFVENELDEKRAKEYSNDIVTEMNQLIDPITLDEEGLYDELNEDSEDLKTLEIDGNKYIGLLEIPDLGLVLPVQKDWSYAKLDNTPCVYQDTPLVIAAHNYNNHFGRIKRLAIGGQIKFTDVEGNVEVYQVMKKEILDETAVLDMKNTEYEMTLFTCNYSDNTQRVVVRLNKI